MLIDTHAHLTSDRFRDRVPEIVAQADAAGIGHIITIGCDLVDSGQAVELASKFPNVTATVGIHPCYVDEIKESDWAMKLRNLVEENEVSGIGEIGLDYYHAPPGSYSESEWRSLQADFFKKQLVLAEELGFPVVIHQRESGDDVLSILQDFPKVQAVLHCFTGTLQQAESALEMGHSLSFTGVVTYPKAPEVREIAAMVPEDRIMVETDSPYLAPVPYRGKSNEPGYVVHTAAKIAEVRGMDADQFAAITTRNAQNFFKHLL
ncbi:MAG: TatD family hydrolase [Verrucomicrobiales bacterium]|nr:TatD family hydrolase [Verrucomicrobiales bacterium]